MGEVALSTPDTCVFDLPVPRRPGLDDVGGGAKTNDPDLPLPNPVTMPTAEDENQAENLLVKYGAVIPVAIVTLHYTAGTPAVFKVASPIATVVPGIFTLTDTGVGNCLVAWPANTFPTAVADPVANATGATPGYGTVESLTNSARVRMTNAAGSLADINSVLFIY
jgi:hypothetical protein